MTVSLELPAIWIDSVILDDLSLAAAAPYFRAINRIPEPSTIQIRTDSLISLDLATEAADAPVAASTVITVAVDGSAPVAAYNGGSGGFQAGWDGSGSAVSNPDADTLRVAIDQVADFGSLQSVVIRVVSTSANGQLIDESWGFTTEDLTAPVVVSAVPQSKTVITLTFDEQVNESQALTPTNYTFARLSVPAVDVIAASVELATSSSINITLDIEMSPGASYSVAVTGVDDAFGNAIVAPFNSAPFTGFSPQSPDGRRFELWKMLSKGSRDRDSSGDLFRFISVLQEPTDLMLCTIDEWSDILDPDIAPEAFVDLMICDLGNPFEFALDLVDKRRLIRILVPIYQQKGTGVGIVNAIRFFLGIEVEVVSFSGEGWTLGIDELGETGTPGTAILGPGTQFALYSFEITSPVVLTEDQRLQIKDIADYMKPAHTHCVGINEPVIPEVLNHLELGLSELGINWLLH